MIQPKRVPELVKRKVLGDGNKGDARRGRGRDGNPDSHDEDPPRSPEVVESSYLQIGARGFVPVRMVRPPYLPLSVRKGRGVCKDVGS